MQKELKLRMGKIVMLFVLLLIAVPDVSAQQLPQGMPDFSTIKVDELSDNQIEQLIRRAEQEGRSLQELEAEAINRGMPYNEVLKLRARINEIQRKREQRDTMMAEQERSLQDRDRLSERRPDTLLLDTLDKLKVFGQEFFNRENLSFEPSLNIPTPTDYILAAGDQLQIDVWGASQQSYEVTITPDGFIRISNLGNINVSGMSVEKASELIINRLSTIYSGLRGPNPNTFASVSLGNIRSIKVSITGEAYLPGTYTLPALSTVFNALYLAGGPNTRGSFREIRLMRKGETFATIDLYDFLAKGQTASNIRLRDEDVIFIPTYHNRITFHGEVKRPAIYELREQETLADLVNITGGFSENAYTQRLKIFRKTTTQQKILDVDESLYASFLMQSGDSIFVEPILKRFENRITLQGAVFREGKFAHREGMTLSQLIELADGLREDAFTPRASIYRHQENLRVEVIAVDLQKVLDGQAEDPLLQKEDLVHISTIFELEEALTLQIFGEVQAEGRFPYSQNMTLGELIRQAEGLKESASLARVEVARRIPNRDAQRPGTQIAEVFNFPLDADLSLEDEAASFVLHPFDIVFVRRSPGYETQRIARVQGEVIFPGRYAIASKNEHISDLVKRAGGFTDEAYLPGATLLRRIDKADEERRRQLEMLATTEFEIITETTETGNQHYIGIDLQRIMSNPRSRHDLIVMDGDILRIPQQLQTVRMSGAVLHPTSARYQARTGVRSYVAQAGGFAENARPGKVYVLYPNGSVDRTRSFMGIRSYPSVEPGAEIIVPQKPDRPPRTLQETIAIGSAISSLALVIVTLINQF